MSGVADSSHFLDKAADLLVVHLSSAGEAPGFLCKASTSGRVRLAGLLGFAHTDLGDVGGEHLVGEPRW